MTQTMTPSFFLVFLSVIFVHFNRNPPSVAVLQNDLMHISDKGGRHWRTVSIILRTGSGEGRDTLSLLAASAVMMINSGGSWQSPVLLCVICLFLTSLPPFLSLHIFFFFFCLGLSLALHGLSYLRGHLVLALMLRDWGCGAH